MKRGFFVTTIAALAAATFAADYDTNIAGNTMPWLSTTTLNASYAYGNQDGASPLVVDSSSGISIEAGNTITISYLSGLTSPFGGTPFADASGDHSFITDANPGNSGNYFPSLFTSGYPVYLNALVGVFADSSGSIISGPFVVNNGPFSAVVPVGATRLQLGFNDDIFFDNTGSINLRVSGEPVPEPASMLALGFGALAFMRRRKSK